MRVEGKGDAVRSQIRGGGLDGSFEMEGAAIPPNLGLHDWRQAQLQSTTSLPSITIS